MTKRRHPLAVLWQSAKVQSCADGTLIVTPVWRDEKPGVFTRIYAARHLQRLISGRMRR